MVVALVERLGFEVDSIDVFCGFGGSSQGMKAAGATVRCAANHNEINLECHSTNFPDTDHWLADLSDPSNPEVVNRAGKKVAGRYLDPAQLPRARYAWFSPACTHHSPANSTKVYEQGLYQAMSDDEEWREQDYVNSERSRVTMSCVLRYVAARRPQVLAVENVVEVTKWGPGRDGSTFKWWLTELRNLGYVPRLCFFNSMFFGPCPQSRDRVYIVAHRRGCTPPDLEYRPTAFCTSQQCGGQLVGAVQTWKKRTKAWMFDQWGKYLGQYDYRCPECAEAVHPASWMALSAIDLSIRRPTLGERIEEQGPPAPNTWERLRRAYGKFYYAPPVVVPSGSFGAEQIEYRDGAKSGALVETRHGEGAYDRNRHISEHLSTFTAKSGVGVAIHDSLNVAVVRNNGTSDGYLRGAPSSVPLHTLTSTPGPQSVLAIVVPNRTNNKASHVSAALAPVMAGTVSQGVIATAAGNTSERPGQTRARAGSDPLFTQSTTAEFGFASMPVLRGTSDSQLEAGAHASAQLLTISAAGRHNSLLTAFTQKINGGPGDTTPHSVADRLGTLTGGGAYGIEPTGLFVLPSRDDWTLRSEAVTDSLAVATALVRQQLDRLPSYEGDITDEMLLGVRWGMLEPDPELRRGMAFEDDYVLIGNKSQMTAGLGNAVTPPVASWITERCLATLRGSR